MKIGRRTMPELPSQGGVYWFDPGIGRGSELRKIRPCIVVSPNEMNQRLRTVIVVPLTSTKQAWPFRTPVTLLDQKSNAACDQVRVIDKSRLKERIGILKPADRANVFSLLQSILSE